MFKSVTLEIVGDQRLVCESCELRVKRLLQALPGLAQARANSRNQSIEILFNSAVLDPQTITERLRTAGYETRVTGP